VRLPVAAVRSPDERDDGGEVDGREAEGDGQRRRPERGQQQADEADRCQRLGLIQYGRLLAEGSPADIRAQGGSPNLEEAFLALAGRKES